MNKPNINQSVTYEDKDKDKEYQELGTLELESVTGGKGGERAFGSDRPRSTPAPRYYRTSSPVMGIRG